MNYNLAVWVIAVICLTPVVALALMSFSSPPMPSNLGVSDGLLAPCTDSPNCVSTQATDDEHAMKPLRFNGDAESAIERLASIVRAEPRTKIVSQSNNYLHAEFTSLVFRFVDDVEFQVEEQANLIHFRSASRVGYYDLGVNRARMERIRELFQEAS